MAMDTRMQIQRFIDEEAITSKAPRRRHDLGVGLLTRTIVQSSVTKGIIPARIRRRRKNDVLFVHDDHVELKQLVGRRLRTVALKADLDANIAAARLIGKSDPREASPESDPSLNEHSSAEVDSEADYALPANILVLVLQCWAEDKLMFMFARDELHGGVTFVTFTWPLPGWKEEAERLGTHLAVDPSSSAMAVASRVGCIKFYALKSNERMVADLKAARDSRPGLLNPIRDETLLDVGGVILKMEFVYPPRDLAHANIVFLLVLLSASGKMQLRLYEWDTTTPLQTIKIASSHAIPLGWQDTVPSVLIPLTVPCSIILTFEQEKGMLAFWDTHIEGVTNSQIIGYPERSKKDRGIDYTSDIGESPTTPIWTAWTRPPRREEYHRDRDSFFLGREDGMVSFIQIHESSRQTSRFSTGCIPHSIDAAFASLDSGEPDSHNGRGDILIVAGSMSDGGLYEYAARETVEPLDQTLQNWSFATDWTVIPKGSKNGSGGLRSAQDGDRIFACCGKGRSHGKLLEVRSGAEAHPISTFTFDEDNAGDSQSRMDLDLPFLVEGQRPTGLWLLPSLDATKPSDPAVLLLSYPGHPTGQTRYHCLDAEARRDPGGREPILDLLIDTGSATLATAITSDELAIQISENAIRAISVRANSDVKVETLLDEGRIAHAYIDGSNSTFLIALSGPKHSLIYGSIHHAPEGGALIQVLNSTDECQRFLGISTVHLCNTADTSLALVGTLHGGLVLFTPEASRHSFEPVSSFTFTGQDAVCESICLINHSRHSSDNSNSWEFIVLCGLRNGYLQVLQMRSWDQVSYSMEPMQHIKIGDPTVHVLPDHTAQRTHMARVNSAIVVCQDNLLRLSFSGTGTPRATQHRIWTPHWQTINAPQGPIFALGQFESWVDEPHALSKVFCYIDERSIRLISVDASKTDHPVPQQVKLSGTPSRLTYSTYLNKLIVAFSRIELPQRPRDGEDEALPRLVFPMLKLVDPDAPEIEAAASEAPLEQEGVGIGATNGLGIDTIPAGKSGERIWAMVEWMPSMRGKQWPLLVTGSERFIENGTRQIGILTVFSLKRGEFSEPGAPCKLEKKKEFRKESPVYAVATFGASSLVCGNGCSLEILELVETNNGFSLWRTANVELTSDVMALSTSQNQIFVSTSHDSHLIYKWENGGLKRCGSDAQARSGQAHIFLNDSKLLLASDLEARVCGLEMVTGTDSESRLNLAFETNMLSPVIRFHRASPRRPRAFGDPENKDTVIGAALNGSFHTFDVLDHEHWQLLRYMQDLAQQDSNLCPVTYRASLLGQAFPRARPSDKHIDGNILARLLERPTSGAEYLQNLVRSGFADMSGPNDMRHIQSEKDREDFFLELVGQAFSDVPPYNAYQRVIGYLEIMLRPIQ